MKAALLALASVGLLCAGCGGATTEGASADDQKGINAVSFALTDEGCDPSTAEIASGATTFEVENKGASAVTEFEVIKDKRILGEVENLAAGLSGEFSLTLQPGTYELYCPNGTSAERGTLTVTGEKVASSDAAAAKQGRDRVPGIRDRAGGHPPEANDLVHRRRSLRERGPGQEAVPDCP